MCNSDELIISIMKQANWAVATWFFYVNGIDGTGAQAIDVIAVHNGGNRTVSIEYTPYKKAMLIFPIMGCTIVWAAMAYAGNELMKSDVINKIEYAQTRERTAKKELEVASNNLELVKKEAPVMIVMSSYKEGGDSFGFDDVHDDVEEEKLRKEHVTKVQEKQTAKNEAQEKLTRATKNLLKKRRTPDYVVWAFVLNIVVKTIPHIILTSIFVNTTSTNGAAIYCLLSLFVDLLVSLRVLSAWLHNRHPTLNVLAWIEGFTMISSFLAWRLEVAPAQSVVLNKLGLATSIVFILALGPFFYACHRTLKENRETIEKNRVDEQKEKDQQDLDIYLSFDDLEIFAGGSHSTTGKEEDRINTAEDEPNLRVRFTTGIEALALTEWMPTTFLLLFFFNTVPNFAVFGGHVTQTGRAEAAVVLALIANCGSGALSLFVSFWWAWKRSATFCFTYGVVLVNMLGAWLFLAVVCFPYGSNPLVYAGAIVGGAGTLVLAPALLRKTWNLRHDAGRLTSGVNSSFDWRKGIELFSKKKAGHKERWDNRTVVMYVVLFAWNCAVIIIQLNWIYVGTKGIRVTQFSLFCSILAALAEAVPPMVWLRSRHVALGYLAAVLLMLLVLIWWTWSAAFYPLTSGQSKAAFALNILYSVVGFPGLLYLAHRQLLNATKKAENTIQQPLNVIASKSKVPTSSSAEETRKREEQRRIKAYYNISKSGCCVTWRKAFYDFMIPVEQVLRDLMTNTATGSYNDFAAKIRYMVVFHVLLGTAYIAVCIQGLRVDGSGSIEELLLEGSGEGEALSLADGGHGRSATLYGATSIIAICIFFELAVLGWWANRLARVFVFYAGLEMFAWMAMLSLFNGPVATLNLTPLIAVSCCATAVMFVQLSLAAKYFAGNLEQHLFWGWGQQLNVLLTEESTFKEKWFGCQQGYGCPPAIWVGLGVCPILLRHGPVVAVVAMSTTLGSLHATCGFALVLAGCSIFVALALLVTRMGEVCASISLPCCNSASGLPLTLAAASASAPIAPRRLERHAAAEKILKRREQMRAVRDAKRDPDAVALGDFEPSDPRCTYSKGPKKRCFGHRVKNSAFCERHTCGKLGCLMFKSSKETACTKHLEKRKEWNAMFQALPQTALGGSRTTYEKNR